MKFNSQFCLISVFEQFTDELQDLLFTKCFREVQGQIKVKVRLHKKVLSLYIHWDTSAGKVQLVNKTNLAVLVNREFCFPGVDFTKSSRPVLSRVRSSNSFHLLLT